MKLIHKLIKPCLVSLSILALLVIPTAAAMAADPYNDGYYRDLNSKLNSWFMPKTITPVSNVFYVDLTQSGHIMLDTSSLTSGASIILSGTSRVPVHTRVTWQGCGYNVTFDGSNSDAMVYANAGAWPFVETAATTASYVYMMDLMTGIRDTGGGMSGDTIYFLAGQTLYQ